VTWLDLFDRWELIELDLQDIGVDIGDPVLMRERSWNWLRTRILGLLTRPESLIAAGSTVIPVPANRLQAAFSSKDVEQDRAHHQ